MFQISQLHFLKQKKYAKQKKLTVIFTKIKNQRTEYCRLLTKLQCTTSVFKCPGSLLLRQIFLLKDAACMTPFSSPPFQPTLSNVFKPSGVILPPLDFVSTNINSLVSNLTLILIRAIKQNCFKLVVVSTQARTLFFFFFPFLVLSC